MQSKPILLIRPKHQATGFAEALTSRFGELNIIFAPLVDIEPLEFEVPTLDDETIIFTSVNAARIVLPKIGTGRHAVAVGSLVASYLEDQGCIVDQVFETATELQKSLPKNAHYFRAEDIRVDIAKDSETLSETIVYRQVQTEPDPEITKDIEAGAVVPVFSAFAAEALIEADILRQNMDILAISQTVAHYFAEIKHASLHIAKSPTRAAMIEALGEIVHG